MRLSTEKYIQCIMLFLCGMAANKVKQILLQNEIYVVPDHISALNFPKISPSLSKLWALQLPRLAFFRQTIGSGGPRVARSLT